MSDPVSRDILVIGATGTQGRAVIRRLLEGGHKVRGLTRTPSSKGALALAARGVTLIQGDLDDRASVATAMQGADGVYLVTDFFKNGIAGEIRQGKLVADLCAELRIGHLVHASVNGADRHSGVHHFDSKGEIEAHIRSLAIPATFLRPAVFMEDLVDKQYFPPASWGMMPKLVGPDRPVKWVSVEDIGVAAATAFARRDAVFGVAVPLVGDEQSMTQARALFARVTGKKPFALPMPTFLFRRVISEDLVLMWKWLATNTMDGGHGCEPEVNGSVVLCTEQLLFDEAGRDALHDVDRLRLPDRNLVVVLLHAAQRLFGDDVARDHLELHLLAGGLHVVDETGVGARR